MKLPTVSRWSITLCKSLFKQKSLLQAAAAALFIGLAQSCSPNISNVLDQQTASETHVAFAGGGWRAHTGHAGWVMSLLHANNNVPGGCELTSIAGNPQCLQSAFTNVKTISANSGGSWFSSMLMYDANFVNQITSRGAFYNWGSTSVSPVQGWLGRQQNKFATFNGECGSETGPAYLECVLKEYFNVNGGIIKIPQTPSWSKFVSEVVYDGYDYSKYGTLGSSVNHQNWAKDKSLLMAGSWITNSIVLNDQKAETYYQVCKNPNLVHTDGDDGGWCVQPNRVLVVTSDVVPVTFTSLAFIKPTGLKALPFIGGKAATYHLGYSGTRDLFNKHKNISLNSGNNTAWNIPVEWAATASSAATGFIASYTVENSNLPWLCDVTQWACMYHFRDLAPGFKLPNGTTQVEAVSRDALDHMSIDDLTSNRVMRVADGGVIDNSGIIQLIGHLQLNTKGNNFNIVAIDEVKPSHKVVDKNSYPSTDISYLFNGAPNNQVKFAGYTLNVPKLKVLESTAPVRKFTWNITGPNNESDYLHYYIYQVKTSENSDFNIEGNRYGTIHVFSSEFGCADPGPENKGDFACYNAMIDKMESTLKRKPDIGETTLTGRQLLRAAFGL